MDDRLDQQRAEMDNPPGWPRPRNEDGLPVPWVSVPWDLGAMITDRAVRVRDEILCQVCAGEHGPDDDVYLFVKSPTVPSRSDVVAVQAMDDGILHERCALLARARCPELVRLRGIGQLRTLRCRRRHVRWDDSVYGLTADLADCERVE
jgi:hypothetical protein